MKIQFIYAFNVTNAESTVNASERIWGALSCTKHTARAKNLSSAEQNAEELPNMWHYKTSRLMLWKPRNKNPGDIQKKFNKTREKLKVGHKRTECNPNFSYKNVGINGQFIDAVNITDEQITTTDAFERIWGDQSWRKNRKVEP